jgi:enoyl-CoA hydratase/carnithine racemase
MKYVDVTQHDGIAAVQMNRGKVNALNPDIIKDLRDAFAGLEKDKSTKAVLLTGHDKFFSFGLDVPELLGYTKPKCTRFLEDFTGFYTRLFSFPKPVIAAINGHAIAGGCMLALACDRRVMVMGKAKISLNEITFGATVFAGSVEMLKSCVGHRNAELILLSGRMYDAEEALLMGLVDRITTEGELDEIARETAHAYTRNDMIAFRSLKSLLRGPLTEEMKTREKESIKEFVKIWYSKSTREQLKNITIKKS